MTKEVKMEIDKETADRIAVLVLKDYRKYLKKELKAYGKGQYLHPQDVVGNQERVKALDLIIRDFEV